MTRALAALWVARGWAYWRDPNTLVVQPGLPLQRRDGKPEHEVSPSVVTFLGAS